MVTLAARLRRWLFATLLLASVVLTALAASAADLASDVVAAAAFAVLLTAAWTWFRVAARRATSPRARRVAKGSMIAALALLLFMITQVDSRQGLAVVPAIALILPLTLVELGLAGWLAILALLGLGLLSVATYFGLALIVIGLLSLPRRPRAYLRAMWPGPIGGTGTGRNA